MINLNKLQMQTEVVGEVTSACWRVGELVDASWLVGGVNSVGIG